MKMNRLAALVALAVLVAGCEKAPEAKKDEAVEITTKEQKLSYIFGQNIGGQFKAEGMDVDVTAFSAGVEDALSDAEPRLAQDDVIAVLESFQQEQIAEREAENSALADKNKAEGDAFLAENGKKEGVVTLESGLQYKIIEEGEGPSPGAEDTVEVHYTGTLIDGTEFDSSHRRGGQRLLDPPAVAAESARGPGTRLRPPGGLPDGPFQCRGVVAHAAAGGR